jgi:hypothetical protein
MNAFERLQIVRGRNSSYLEVQIMHRAGKMSRRFQVSLHKCFVDDHLGGDICQFTSLLGFHLFSHRLEVSLHPIHPDRDAIDE